MSGFESGSSLPNIEYDPSDDLSRDITNHAVMVFSCHSVWSRYNDWTRESWWSFSVFFFFFFFFWCNENFTFLPIIQSNGFYHITARLIQPVMFQMLNKVDIVSVCFFFFFFFFIEVNCRLLLLLLDNYSNCQLTIYKQTLSTVRPPHQQYVF